jgi:hypothetical protein
LTARDYMESRAILPEVAAEVGVVGNDRRTELHFPNGRRRVLETGRVLQAKGRQLESWWVKPPEEASWEWVLVCEGESDTLAARSYLPATPACSGLPNTPILCVPGTGYPVDRLVADLRGKTQEAWLAFDPDTAGQRYMSEATEALLSADVHPIRIEVPEPDLAGWLAGMPEQYRSFRLADLLVDCANQAPSIETMRAHRTASALEAQAHRLRAAA